MQYSIYSLIRKITVVLIIFLTFACNEKETELSEVFTLIKENNIDTNNLEEVYILSSEECMTCNKAFSAALESKFDKPNTAIVLLADPTRIDLSAFKNHKNVVFVDQATKANLKFLYNSKVLYIKNQRVVDSIVLDAHTLDQQMERIRLN